MKKRTKPEPQRHRGLDLADRLDAAASWRRGLVVFAFLIIVLCIFIPELFFQNGIFLVPDTKAPLSFASVGKEALEKGIYPLWNPYLFCGMPSYPSLTYNPYVYPVSFITHVLQFHLGAPEMTWLLFHYLLAGIGVYMLSRSLGARAAVSMIAGALFMVMPGYIATGAYGHGSQACATAYMPFALLFARNIFRGRKRVLMTALLTIVLGFQILRGHVQISYYTYMLIGLLFIYESVAFLRKGNGRTVAINLAFAAAAFVAALGLAAVLIFPVREYAQFSIRGGGGAGLDYGYATGWSLHPKEVLTFFFAWAFGFGKTTYWGEMPFTDYPNYLGVLTVGFGLAALFIVRGGWKWFLILAAALSTLISFGKFMPALYGPMFRFLPLFNKFRVPVMVLIVQQLALVLLMAVGMEEFLRRLKKRDLPKALGAGYLKWYTIAGAVIFVLVLVGAGNIREGLTGSAGVREAVRGEWLRFAARAFTDNLLSTVFLFTLFAFLLFVSVSRRLAVGAVVTMLLVLGLLDMFIVDRPILHPEKMWRTEGYRIIRGKEERENFMKPNDAVNFLKADTTYFRIFPAPAAPAGRWSHSVHPFSDNSYMIFRIFSMGGYHAAKPKKYQDVMDLMFESFNRGSLPLNILNMLNAKYIVSLFPLFREGSPVPLVYQEEGKTYIYRNPGALPRAFLVDRFRVLAPGKALRTLVRPDFDPAQEVLLERRPDVAPETKNGSHANITEYDVNSITVRAHIEKPCILVMSEMAYPDWKAEVDGVETEILTADYCLRAIPLRPGDHMITFEFSSGVIRISLIVSIMTFALAVTVAIIYKLIGTNRG